MGEWSGDSKTHVSHMDHDDFFGSEKSYVTAGANEVRIELHTKDGKTKVLKEGIKLQAGKVMDGGSSAVEVVLEVTVVEKRHITARCPAGIDVETVGSIAIIKGTGVILDRGGIRAGRHGWATEEAITNTAWSGHVGISTQILITIMIDLDGVTQTKKDRIPHNVIALTG